MLSNGEMLNYVMQNAEMGCCGISTIKGYAQDEKLQSALRSQMIEYGKIYYTANQMLKNSREEACRISPMVRKMTKYVTKRNMEKDDSDSHIAQMMINGNVKGVTKIVDRIRDYNCGDQKVESLAKKLLETEQNNIQQMFEFI